MVRNETGRWGGEGVGGQRRPVPAVGARKGSMQGASVEGERCGGVMAAGGAAAREATGQRRRGAAKEEARRREGLRPE